MSPRKPNSAKRTFAKVRIQISQKKIFAKIPGIGDHFLQAHSVVLVRGHGPKDSPGINYNLIRGLYDFNKVELFGRQNRRSKFGVKNAKKI
jgi:ribosomal protein S12